MGRLMNRNKNIVVVGHLVWDRLNYQDGKSVEGFGGIAYNLAALASLVREHTTIFPICYLGKDLESQTREYWSRFDNIDWSFAGRLPQKQEIHVLTYDNTGYRKEDNHNLFPKIATSLFAGLQQIDIALVNYIGGNEFPPESLRWLKKIYNPTIYLDFHSLALSRVSKNTRQFRHHPHWQKYTSQADIVQMNVYELRTLFPVRTDDWSHISKVASKVLETGPKVVIVTRESEDLIVVRRDSNKIIEMAFPVPSVTRIVDSTGCGDTFAGGFVSSLSRGSNIESCCRDGLAIASKKVTFSGINGFFKKI
jgi:sugar/nucleoside kinase (ribokinase family)